MGWSNTLPMNSWRKLPDEKRKWWILSAMTASLSMIFIDITVLPVTLPTLNRELNFSLLSFQWIINIYTLALTIFAMAGGRLAHLLGLKSAFCLGITIFAIASAFCGLSNFPTEMIIARAFQGIGASMMIPSQQAIMLATFPPHQRGKALGFYVSASSIFLAIGPFVGGSLTQYLSWRYIFWINLPIAAFGLIFTQFVVPSFKRVRESFDWKGFFILGAGVSSLMVGIMQTPILGWESPYTLLLLAFGIAMIAYLWFSEAKHPHPLFDISLMRKRSFIAGSLTTFCNAFLIMITVHWAIFFQEVLKYTPSQAGSLSSFSTLPVLFFAPIAGYLVDRYGPRLPVSLGFGILIVSLSLFLAVIMHHILWAFLISLFLFGMNMSLIFTPSYLSIMHDVDPEKRGIASGMNTTLRQFGSTLGLAVFGTVFYQCFYWKFARGLEHIGQGLNPYRYEGALSHNPQALKALQELPEDTGALVTQTMTDALVDAFDLINILAIGIAFIGLCIALRLLKNTPLSQTAAPRR
jgi:EmrB/QacA subfamily drug resistance transporter